MESLRRQSLSGWQLIVVNDGSRDETEAIVTPYLADPRVSYVKHDRNRGLGAALNAGLERASGDLIAYLPSDDVYYSHHLELLADSLIQEDAVLAVAGMQVDSRGDGRGAQDYGLQLVQVMHRATAERWMERAEIETDDLEAVFFHRLLKRGRAVHTGHTTCQWVQHPAQRHRAILESFDGGLNVFRSRYKVSTPLRFRSRDSHFVDEGALFRQFRRSLPPRHDGLKILLVGELSYHPERIVALEERGHSLFGLWTEEPLGSTTVGPLPFGRVQDVPRTGWKDAVRKVRPDIIYALLNWRAVGIAHEVLRADTGIPFVWHFKESPMRCIERGAWPQLAELCRGARVRIYSSALEREWFESALPDTAGRRTEVINGDLPSAVWFTDNCSTRLSETDGEIHTVAVGGPIGLNRRLLKRLAADRVHTHFYGLIRDRGPRGRWQHWIDEAIREAPGYVHVHPHVDQRAWVSEFSKYDAGWLHLCESANGGEIARATWDDLNIPARLSTVVSAGVPVLHRHSAGARVEVQDLVRDTGIGVAFNDADDVCEILTSGRELGEARAAAWERRLEFSFDHHVDRLIDVFHDALQ
jgi:glycosyltransferase involved in cell wall biosynthesis